MFVDRYGLLQVTEQRRAEVVDDVDAAPVALASNTGTAIRSTGLTGISS